MGPKHWQVPTHREQWHPTGIEATSRHGLPLVAFSILAQVSRNPTVRLKTSRPGLLSVSAQK